MNGANFINNLKRKWQGLLVFRVILYALGTYFFTHFTFDFSEGINLGISAAVNIIGMLIVNPWQITRMHAARLVDRQVKDAESSAVLLVNMAADSSNLYKLQQQKVGRILQAYEGSIRVPHHLLTAFIIALVVSVGGYLIGENRVDSATLEQTSQSPEVIFSPEDSTEGIQLVASIEQLEIQVTPPAYTKLRSYSTTNPNLDVIDGSIVKWKVTMSAKVGQLSLNSGGTDKAFTSKDDLSFEGTWKTQASGFYNFEFLNGEERMVSDIYQIEVTKDEAPEVEVLDLDQYVRFNYDDAKKVSFNTSVTDDFGLIEANIIATVAKGSGESVKFREEQLEFDNTIRSGGKAFNLSKRIDLDEMGLTPGDELYFYVQATDNKQPIPNITRTATYFLSVIDTTNIEFSLAGSLGVDLMPDYFRSQRQIIIETEQLIKDKPVLATHDFNFTSNELGFDQKALRIRYGQFMGEEFESGIMMEDAEGNVIGEEDDPLAAYSHAHDTENEANLVDKTPEKEEEDLLEQYKDSHEDNEEATFFSVSIKEKLRQAMTEMWDAELYLRLYEPEKSLPYQYRALELLKQIKNHARVYVHRIGFDPPPIKEETRLSGDLDELNSLSRAEALATKDKYVSIKRSIARMATLIESKQALSEADKQVFEQAGNELSGLAIASPGAYLNTLQQLKQLSFDNLPEAELSPILTLAYQGLVNVLPKQIDQPAASNAKMTQLKKAMLAEIEKISNER